MNKKQGWTCVYLPYLYLYKQEEKQKRTFLFALMNHLSQMEFSFVRMSFLSLLIIRA